MTDILTEDELFDLLAGIIQASGPPLPDKSIWKLIGFMDGLGIIDRIKGAAPAAYSGFKPEVVAFIKARKP